MHLPSRTQRESWTCPTNARVGALPCLGLQVPDKRRHGYSLSPAGHFRLCGAGDLQLLGCHSGAFHPGSDFLEGDVPRDVEIGFLDTDGDGDRHDRLQPPVIGGKNAISRAPAITVSDLTWAWSIAARITRGVSKAWA